MLSPGSVLDRYTVEALIGQGGMAVVYRVRHNQLGGLHALKILTAPKPKIRDRLLQEGRAQAVIRHPNVVAVTDVVEIDGSPGLVMEYVPGPTLEALLEREGRLALDEAEVLFLGICAGVGEAHLGGLVHRDLKPANVLLFPLPPNGRSGGSGERFVPKVTDFGIAKLLEGDSGSTRTNVAMGTPHYMAPEQIRDAKGVDRRADVFSLGCILYELVTGRRPFDGPDVLTILNAVATGRYVPPRLIIPDLPERFANAIDGALRVERDQRIPDTDALLRVLTTGQPHFDLAPDSIVNVRTSGSTFVPPRSDSESGTFVDSEAATQPPLSIRNAGGALPTTSGANGVRRLGMAAMALAGVSVLGIGGLAVGALAVLGTKLDQGTDTDGEELVMAVTQDVEPFDPEIPMIEATDPGVEGVVGPLPTARVAASSNTVAVSPATHSEKQRAVDKGIASAERPSGLGLFDSTSAPTVARGKGRVEVIGMTQVTMIDAKNERFPPGELPAGHYAVEVKFAGREPRVDLELDLQSGRIVRIDCESKPNACTLVR